MRVILLFGPQAVGKMSIGEKVSEEIGLPLLYNHVTLDAIWPYIGWNERTFELSDQLRLDMFEYISADEEHQGLVFTFVWAFDRKEDWAFVEKIQKIFSDEHQEIYFIELEADLEERLRRNKTENRLLKKPSKRDVEYSENELLSSAKKNRLNSYPNEIQEERYLRMNVTNLSIEESTQKIVKWLDKDKNKNKKEHLD